VGGLVEESFFVACAAHEDRKKNEKNIFCLGCVASICPHCAPAHRHHPLIQVTLLPSSIHPFPLADEIGLLHAACNSPGRRQFSA
jgi:hypothetical protein